jgi:putative transposase
LIAASNGQEGYAAFTVSPTATDSVQRYIATQEAHHHKHSFVDEFKELLNAARIEFDDKYLPLTSGTPSGCDHD